LSTQLPDIASSGIARELSKSSYPIYRAEPPDILLIEAVQNIRPADDTVRAGDQLFIQISDALPLETVDPDPVANEFRVVNSVYSVQADGTVDLGPEYGVVKVEGLTVPNARTAVEEHVRNNIGLMSAKVALSMPNVEGKQAISGEHLVRLDGTVSLGIYGSVFVSGLTLEEIKYTVEGHLSQYLHDPEVSVDVLAYNSKVFYFISDGGGFGESVTRLPCTGNETVLDAIAEVEGLSDVSSKNIWVARPAPGGTGVAQRLVVDWRAITEDGIVTTNYQLFPGDRIYVRADHMITLDNFVAKTTAPFERVFGFLLLGNGTVRALQRGRNANNGRGNGNGNGGF
jgi:polysaccharide export outer membrane protein